MPQETNRLKLPLPLGNENVTRESINGIFEKIDAGVATQADLDTLREAVSQMDIPDASLTQKGKVQLSSKTDGTSETVAATERAVRDARVAAINAAATDAATKSNAAETNARDYINAKPWQRVRVTADDGSTMMLSSGYDINSDMSTGFYRGVGIVNAPDSGWWHLEVLKHDSSYATQVAYPLDRSYTYRMRVKSGGIWGPWSPDVFQSGVDAKNGIVGAINAKGGSASTNDTWAQLSAKVQAIQTGVYSASVPALSYTDVNVPANQTAWVRNLVTIPANVKTVSLAPVSGSSQWSLRISSSYGGQISFALKDANGLFWKLTPSAWGGVGQVAVSVYGMQINLVAGTATSLYLSAKDNWALNEVTPANNVGSISTYGAEAKPAGFDSSRDMILGVYANAVYSSVWNAGSWGTDIRLLTT
ncbi:pyocin knob domain-containing protein [Paenibacillus sp. OK076]|uniref:pyocin knob domain-containing protein n=1 Tax=Paenibacillus sp. OK076 TaxID=1884379 RepID=UPI0008D5E8ED|nr:pyocin knob domain-containing protein [Paenibacillus sp. OK076]SEM85689.1 Phage tail fibre repeat-containing protein [Paenibacillus sp. OK076]